MVAMADSSIFFVKLPSQQQLCHVTMKVNTDKFDVHLQVLKCRHLLHLCPAVIAAPQVADKMLIDAVLQVDFYKRKFAAVCHKLQLKPVHASNARNYVMERCILYTLKFRLSPHWNQVGSVLVCNKEFLHCYGKMEAVHFEVSVMDNEMTLKVKPYLVRIPPARLESFGICPEALERFRDDFNYEIPESAINLQWCHILPTMNRGQVISISHKIPCNDSSDRLLKDYEGLTRYWKSQYGYELPPSSEDVVYCSVLFKQISFNCFTYPLVCLRNRSIQFMPRCDGPEITKSFMTDIRQRLGRLCSFPLTYAGKACCPVTSLSSSSKIKTDIPQNVKVREETKDKKIIQTKSSEILSKSDNAKVPNLDVIPPTQGSTLRAVPSMEDCELVQKLRSSGFPTTTGGKYIPVFMAKHKSICGTLTSTRITNKNPKFKPVVKCNTNKAIDINRKIIEKASSTPTQNSPTSDSVISGQRQKKQSLSRKKSFPKEICGKEGLKIVSSIVAPPLQNMIHINEAQSTLSAKARANKKKLEKVTSNKRFTHAPCLKEPQSAKSKTKNPASEVSMKLDPCCLRTTAAQSSDGGLQCKLRLAKTSEKLQFEQVFTCASSTRDNKSDEVSDSSVVPCRKTPENHKFNQLFTSASARAQTQSSADVTNSSTSIAAATCGTTPKTQKLNQLFACASSTTDISSYYCRKVPNKHKFHELFSSASSSNALDAGNVKSSAKSLNQSNVRIAPRKKGRFDELFMPASH